MNKKRLYIDMDNVFVNFRTGIEQFPDWNSVTDYLMKE